MKEVRFAAVDVTNQAQVDAWIDVIDRSAAADLVEWPPESRAQRIVALTRKQQASRTDQVVAIVDDQVVGAAELYMPLADNTGLVEIELNIDPAWRRQGIGTALLREVEARAERENRHIRLAWVPRQREDGVWCDDSGEHFALAHGYEIATAEVHRRADVSAGDQAEQDALLARCWQSAGQYESVSYDNHTPDDIVDGVAYLEGRVTVDSPTGDLAVEKDNVDSARVRENEAKSRTSGSLRVGTAVRHRETGAVAGFTVIVVPAGFETDSWQGATIVDPEHRGNRLGTILKLENHRQLRRLRPQMRYVHTWNDSANSHMIAINEATGYQPRETWLAMQQKAE